MIQKIKNAFTLVEILVIIAIIVLLAALAVPNIIRARITSHDAVTRKTLASLTVALEYYLNANLSYPTSVANLLTGTPPYINKDFFTGTHAGFTYSSNILPTSYTITATPVSVGVLGSTTFTLKTGGVISPP